MMIHTDANFGGGAQALAPGVYNQGAFGLGDNTVSSLTVPPGWTVTLYEHPNFYGRRKTFTSNTAYVGDDFENITSAIIVQGPSNTGPAVIFNDVQLQGGGGVQALAPGVYNLAAIGMGDNAVSSLMVPSGWTVTLYEHPNFYGRRKTFTSNTTYVGDDFENITSAIIVQGPSNTGPAVIFDDLQLQGGGAQALVPGIYHLSDIGMGDNAVSSLMVPPGWTVTLYEHPNFYGRRKTFTSNTTYVGNDFENITSAILVEAPLQGEATRLGYPIAGTVDDDDLKWRIASDPLIIEKLAKFAYALGFAYCNGTRDPVTGRDFEVYRAWDGSYVMKAHYDKNDPWLYPYHKADDRLKITLSNFRTIIDPSTFSYGAQSITSVEQPFILSSQVAENRGSTESTMTVGMSDSHTDSYAHTTSSKIGAGLKVTVKSKAKIPFLIESEVSTELSINGEQGWSDMTTNTTVVGTTINYQMKVPAMSRKRLELLAYRTKSDINYNARALIAFTIKFEGHLRSGALGNAHVNHPTDEAPFSVTFGNDSLSGFGDILDKYDHRYIGGYSDWDWFWMQNNFGPLLDEALPFFRGGVVAPLNGKFSNVAGGTTFIREYPAQLL
ncbi:hypothetical protein D187_008815 [Cystobacter fuscus DSM 2262]|uniref:Aerolysin-like C-terminal domain-containing protein n=2 Tax=Cystobacter fuscus TaxID=43 RepID=S9PJP7_CYSF2|nr:hypothetical protein D187_008815 [Cystobacter fuscus DSM 2262]